MAAFGIVEDAIFASSGEKSAKTGPVFSQPRSEFANLPNLMGSLIKKRRKRMRKKKHKKMLKRTRFQRRAKKK